MLKFPVFHKYDKWELPVIITLFLLLWVYLFIRANTVFFGHDEIVTKWSYMVFWNPLPYMGYIDANNHFLNSFLGGFFIRLFQSDAMWIVRLPNLLSFPVYYWSAIGFYKYFNKKVNFYAFLISLTFTPFILEFFGLARGYGISIALLLFALQQTIVLINGGKHYLILTITIAWILAVYSNLTLIPFALAGLVYIAIYLWLNHSRIRSVLTLTAVLPILYAIKYSFHLKSIGKLYHGQQENFIQSTIHSLTRDLWSAESTWLDGFLIALATFIFTSLLLGFWHSRKMFKASLVLPLFFVMAVCSILIQNWVLDVNFPQNRAALYLVVFFYAGFCFAIDYWNNQWMGYVIMMLTIAFFIIQFNFEKTRVYKSGHHDIELLTQIPEKIHGIPPSTGGGFWNVENELARYHDFPVRAFQEVALNHDTLHDYIIATPSMKKELADRYHPLHVDHISGITLMERNHFLPRQKIHENSIEFNVIQEYFNLYADTLNQPLFIRCSGLLENIDKHTNAIMVVSAEDTSAGKSVYYRALSIVQSGAIVDGKIDFDFTFAMNKIENADLLKVYLWNKRKLKLQGAITMELYKIGD